MFQPREYVCRVCTNRFIGTFHERGCCSNPCRFWSKVSRAGPDECWLWLASRAKAPFDYGRFHLRREGVAVASFAHRVAFILHNGIALNAIDVPVVRHTCDNPPCCNPAHLLAGTHADNMRDMHDRGRYRGGGDAVSAAHARLFLPRGERHPQAKLDADKVQLIRTSGLTVTQLSRALGISRSSVGRVRDRKTWQHLPLCRRGLFRLVKGRHAVCFYFITSTGRASRGGGTGWSVRRSVRAL